MATTRRSRLVALFALAAAGTVGAVGLTATGSAAGSPAGHAHGVAHREEFRAGMRKLWEDHITWTRMYIVAAEAAAPETSPTAERLLRNQDDIGAAIAPFYGAAAGSQLSSLLREHILGAAALLDAVMHGGDVATAKANWYANADEIAAFLAAANPKSWPEDEMRDMMHEHLDLTLAEAADHLGGDFAKDIADYDMIHDQILQMADMLADGIITQFPQQFG